MSGKRLDRLRNSRGFTILEVMIAALITGILATASFRFYTAMHNQTETQAEVSDVQHLCRSSVHEIKKTLRLAGFKLTTHNAIEINGDSLAIYYSDTQPVDTVLYFLEEFSDSEYFKVKNLPDGQQLYKLMKKENSAAAVICTDFIRDVDFQVVDSKTIEITVLA
ncbi:MAG: prepilin-type N-terminal cleavage/methylation domain-containing protein, partial [candidate division Zixibacteria bacterium]